MLERNPQVPLQYTSSTELHAREMMQQALHETPIPPAQLLENLGLYMNSKLLARILFFQHVYQQIVNVPGVCMEFGARWGQNLALLVALRGIYEPFNRHRKIIGFDTFTGFPALSQQDGHAEMMYEGHLAVPKDYVDHLTKILTASELDNPLSHIKKFEICSGDVCHTLKDYLAANPQTIIAFAYFDLDLYEPTLISLQAIKKHLVIGSVIGFDELNDSDSPGETLALMEAIGLNQIELKRLPFVSRVSYFVYAGN